MADESFECYVDIISGENLQRLLWRKNEEVLFNGSGIADPMLYNVGGMMIVDRFHIYEPSYDYEEMKSTAFINTNYEFTARGYLKAFEAYVIRPGGLAFMILKPTCSDSGTSKYCNSEKKCVSITDACIDTKNFMEFQCSNENPVFCAECGRCLPADVQECDTQIPSLFPTADFEVIYVLAAYADHYGSNVFKVPEYVAVEPGYILGWYPTVLSPGDIGVYANFSDCNDQVFTYPETYQVFIGSVFSRRLTGAGVTNSMHHLQAYVFTATRHSYTFQDGISGQEANISVALFGGREVAEDSAIVYISNKVLSLELKPKISVISPGQTVLIDATAVFSVPASNKLEFCINWGVSSGSEGCDTTTTASRFSHLYEDCGVYTVSVMAYNKFFNATNIASVIVKGNVTNMDFISKSEVVSASIGSPNEVHLQASGVGEFVLLLQIDDTAAYANVVVGNEFLVYLNMTFYEEHTASCLFQLLQYELDSDLHVFASVSVYGHTQISVSNLGPIENSTVGVKETHLFELGKHKGTNLTYVWEWGDGSHDMLFNVTSASHTYSMLGNYTVHIWVFNDVSEATVTFIVRALSIISGLSFGDAVMKTEFKKETSVVFFLSQGSGLTLMIDYGDGNFSTVAYDIDTTGTHLFASGKHVYQSPGYYNVSVHASSAFCSSKIWNILSVEVAIQGFDVYYVQETPGDIEVGEYLYFNMTVSQGSAVMFNVSFGDSPNVITTPNLTHVYAYKSFNTLPGFTVEIKAFNAISLISKKLLVPVQRPVQKISGLRIWAEPENSTEAMQINYNVTSGDFFVCNWKISSFGGVAVFQTTYEDYLLQKFIKRTLDAGEYNVSLNCTNRLSSASSKATVFSYNPISEFNFQAVYDCGDGEKAGQGGSENIYPLDCKVIFVCSNQKGTNVSYEFFFGYSDKNGVEYRQSTFLLGRAIHVFQLDNAIPKQQIQAKVLLTSPVGMRTASLDINLYQRVQNLSVVSDGPGILGFPVNFTFHALSLGYESCYLLDWGDQSKGAVFGHASCSMKDTYASAEVINGFLPSTILAPFRGKMSHQYNSVGLFTVSLIGENLVSKVHASHVVKVLDKPCNAPMLNWTSAMGISLQDVAAAPFKRCLKVLVTQVTTVDCQKTDAKEYSWGLRKLTSDLKGVDKIIPVKSNDSIFEIPPRWLDYGIYQLSLNACMVNVAGSCSRLLGYFSMSQCELQPGFAGGSGSAVAWNSTFRLAADRSMDPDAVKPYDRSNQRFDWYCKLSNETWPANVSSLPSIWYPQAREGLLRSGGCFNTSIGRLTYPTANGTTLTLDTVYMQIGATHDILLVMSIPGSGRVERNISYSLKVSAGAPPIISIICKLNCQRKINLNWKTSLVASVIKQDSRKLVLLWSLAGALEGKQNDGMQDMNDLLFQCSDTKLSDINLVIRENCLLRGYVYRVKLEGFAEGFRSDGGYTEYALLVNKPPQIDESALDSGCEINPRKGPNMEKIFNMFCVGYIDPDNDLPLSFKFYFELNGENYQVDGSALPKISEKFSLPAGVKRVFAVAVDVYGAECTRFYISVEVEEQKLAAEVLKNAIQSVNVDNIPAAASTLLVVLSASQNADVKPEEVATQVMAVVSRMIPRTADACLMVSTLTNSASVIDGGQSLKDMAVMTQGRATSVECLEQMTPEQKRELAAASMQSLAKVSQTLDGEQGAATFRMAEEIESRVLIEAAKDMVVGERPKVFAVEGGTLTIVAIDSDEGGFIGEPDCGILIPKGSGVGGGMVAAERLPLQNAFTTGPKIAGKRKSLSASASISNLTIPVRICMPNTDTILPDTNYTAYRELLSVIHIVPCTVNSSVLILKLKPVLENFTGGFFVFLEKGRLPSYADHRWNCTLPNPEPELFWNMSTDEQEFFNREQKWRCFFSNEALNETCTGRYFIGVVFRSNVTENFTATIAPVGSSVPYAVRSGVPYRFYAYTRTCLFWDGSLSQWSSDGCNVSPETTDQHTICYCNHLTDFGGAGIFATPQPIDFSKAFAGFSNLGQNPTVFSVVMALIGLYAAALVWCRWKDKKDLLKIVVAPLPDNHPNDQHFYEISVQTGYKSGCSTTADVFIILHGALGESAPRRLSNPSRQCFSKGECDVFLMSTPYTLGSLNEVDVWHNNSGKSPGWYLLFVQVRDVQTERRYRFLCNKWLDVAEDDGRIRRTLPRAERDDLLEFSYMFPQTARKNLLDGHLWFSIVTRPARSSFTRCQRLNCCWSLLLTTMLANAMFYTGGDKPTGQSIRIGSISISIEQIRIGITSSLIVIPVNLLIVTLFKKAGPPKDKQNGRESKAADKDGSLEQGEKEPTGCLHFLRTIIFAGKEDDAKKNFTPHWLIYIAYVLVLISSSVSAFFVVMYGFTFGKQKSDKWIVSMVTSITQSVFIIQPVKIIVTSVLSTLLLKDPDKIEDKDDMMRGKVLDMKLPSPNDNTHDHEEDAATLKITTEVFLLPSEQKLEDARQKRLKEKQMKSVIREIIVHLLFVFLCLFVAYGALDPFAFHLANSTKRSAAEGGIMKAFSNLSELHGDGVLSQADWYDWVENSLIPYLFLEKWYNDDPGYKSGFVADSEASKVLALARFRQLRVKHNTCKAHPLFAHMISMCNSDYSMNVEDDGEYSNGWKPPLNLSELTNMRRNKRKAMWIGLQTPWVYQSMRKLKNFPFWGKHAIYGGGSFAVNIGPDQRIARLVVANMKEHFWVDRYTRAIFTEANIYNANTNLLMTVTILHEVLSTGGWDYFYNIQSLRLYRYVGGLGSFLLISDLIFVVVTLAGIYTILKQCYKLGVTTHFTNTWSALHAFVTVFSVSAIVCTIARAFAVKLAMSGFREDPEVFISFAYAGQLESFAFAFIGIVVFSTNLEFLHLLRFNRRITLLTETMRSCTKTLLSFSIVFFTVFMAYVFLGHFIFVDKLEQFRTFGSTLVEMFSVLLGKFDLQSYFDNDPVFGPILFFSFMIIMQMILVNFFVGIVCEAFAQVRADGSKRGNDHEIVSFMTRTIRHVAGNKDGAASGFEPTYTEWPSDWDRMMSSIEVSCDNLVYLLRNLEAEEVRQEEWFEVGNSVKKKHHLLAALIGLDYFQSEAEFCDGIPILDKMLKEMTDADVETFVDATARYRRNQYLVDETASVESSE